jgi:hypothetical protein
VWFALFCLRAQDVGQLQQQNGELRGMAQQLQARLEEEGEVVSALRAQLVDYKLQVRGRLWLLPAVWLK